MPKATIEYPDDIVIKNNNGGWHPKGKRAYRNAVRTILQFLQTAKEPRIYHLCFEGKTHKVQMKMLNGMVQIADRAGIKLEWFACREVADKTKKAHIHAFIIIDAYGINPYSVFNQFDDGKVGQLCIKHGINFSIFSPKDELGIHGNTDYIALPYQGKGNKQTPRGGERLKDALRWLTYCYKARSKPLEEEADGQLFPASRPNRKKKLDSPSAPQAEKEAIPEQTTNGDEMELTAAGYTYLATQYETCVDQGLDIVQIQRYLSSKGISRSLRQVKHELDSVFCFAGYAQAHPAPPRPDTAMLDAAIDRTPLKSAKGTQLSHGQDRTIVFQRPGKIYQTHC